LSRRELTDLAADDKLIHIYDDTMEVAFAYDGAGNRIRKMSIINDDTAIVKYSYDGSDLLFEHDDTDAVAERYLYGPGIDNILETETAGGAYLHFADGLGSVARITNSSGDVLKTMRYDAFGNFLADSGSTDGDYVSFTGREYDDMFGLYYYRARYYSPMTGRFTTRDPIGLAGGDFNLYRHTRNNPVNFIDPLGLFLEQFWNDPSQRADHRYDPDNKTYQEFVAYARGKSLDMLSNEWGEGSNGFNYSAAGPSKSHRYVIDPANPNQLIDMRHFLNIGQTRSEYFGLMVEIVQKIKGQNESAFHAQDFLSNYLGVEFFGKYYSPFNPDFASQLEKYFEDRAKLYKGDCK